MCGITACVGVDDPASTLLAGLRNLEYRGYDSAGIAVQNGAGIDVRKREGNVERLATAVERTATSGSVGIGHTRWSTHGPPTDANAHPHTDCDERLAVVHNGIIENHDALRDHLESRGHEFTSETDTEVIPHLVADYLAAGHTHRTAFAAAVEDLSGSYAIVLLAEGTDTLFATRRGSPLVLGIDDGSYYLASDVPAFLEFTDRVVFLEDGDVVELSPAGYAVRDESGQPVDRAVETIDWTAKDVEKGQFDHFMLKEIHEQPTALPQAIRGRCDPEAGEVSFDALAPAAVADVERVQFVACGTSYHAARYGAQLLRDRGVPARAFLASEYAATNPPARDGTLLVGVTQSGETADTLAALRCGMERGLPTLAVTNVVGSTAARECDEAVFIRAGPEIGVAATKTFSSQVVTLAMVAEYVAAHAGPAYSDDVGELLASLRGLPEQVASVLDRSRAAAVAERFQDSDAYFFVGRGTGHPVALEGALKLKEISYEHAEGFPAGELKHGPLALVTANTPVFVVCTGDHPAKLRGTMEEVRARGAPVVAVAPRGLDRVTADADEVLTVPGTHPDVVGLSINVQLQLVAYHTATLLDRPVDKPRNLAKSVTVE